jgi:RNA polymerase sigma factor (sigma-70 family)
MDDWQLLERHLAGDAAAMETLVRRHIDLVYATARRAFAGRPAAAEHAQDVAQAVFLLLTQKAPRILRRGSLVGWLYRATLWCAANVRRQEARRHRHEEAAMSTPAPPAAPADAHDWRDLLDAGLARLKEPERTAVLLRHLEQRSFDEAAAALGTSAEAVRKRADRGVDKLRAFFAARGFAMPAASIATGLATHAAAAPATTLQTALSVAHGNPPAAQIAALARPASTAGWGTKAALATAAVGAIALAAFLPLFAQTPPVPAPPPAAPAPPPVAVAAPAPAPAPPTLSRVELIAADPAHPTEAEVKTFLKARLERLSNVIVKYRAHTVYAPPAGGWPTFPDRPADASPPDLLIAAPAASVVAYRQQLTAQSAVFLFPSGTLDVERSFSQRGNQVRYERKVGAVRRDVPYPPSLGEFHEQTFIVHADSVDRLFLDASGTVVVATTYPAALPEPDIECALMLAGFTPLAGRMPLPPMRIAPGAEAAPLVRTFTPADVNSFLVTFPDDRHVKVQRALSGPSRGGRGRTTVPGGAPVGTLPAGRSPPQGRGGIPTALSTIVTDEWLLDRDVGYAPVTYEDVSGQAPVRMAMSTFREVGGVRVPGSIAAAYPLAGALAPGATAPATGPAELWREDTLTITDVQIQDPANTPERYVMTWPEGKTPRPDDRTRPVAELELQLGADMLNSGTLTSLNPNWMGVARPGGPAPQGSPSTPASRDIPVWRATHDDFVRQAKAGDFDVLVLGDTLAREWADDGDAWSKAFGERKATAFAIAGDGVEHVLWRAAHGELDGPAPKVVVLCVGATDMANARAANDRRPSLSSTTPVANGVSVNWARRKDTPEEIAAGVGALVQAVRQKHPAARVVVLGMPPRPASGRFTSSLPARGSPLVLGGPSPAQLLPLYDAFNAALRQLEDGVAVRFVDLAKEARADDGTPNAALFQSNGQPTAALYAKWADALQSVVREWAPQPR